MKQTCPTCGHDVKVVGDTTQHYEPIGCFQITDDHQLCDQQVQQLRETLFGLMTAVEAHKRYWPRVDWGSEGCERAILTALAKGKETLDATLG